MRRRLHEETVTVVGKKGMERETWVQKLLYRNSELKLVLEYFKSFLKY